MKRMKKLLALVLAGVMILSCTVFVNAASTPTSDLSSPTAGNANASGGTATGAGSSEGALPAKTVAVVLPVAVTNDYNMILDPHGLLKDTGYKRFGNAPAVLDEDGEVTTPAVENVRFSDEADKLFFLNADAVAAQEAVIDEDGETELTPAVEASPALYSSTSNERKIVNMSLMDIDVTLEVAVTKGDADFVTFVEKANLADKNANDEDNGAQAYIALQTVGLASAAPDDGDAASAAVPPNAVEISGDATLLTGAEIEFVADLDSSILNAAASALVDGELTLNYTADADGEGNEGYTVTETTLGGYTVTYDGGTTIAISTIDEEDGTTAIPVATITLEGLTSGDDGVSNTLTLKVDASAQSETIAVDADGKASASGTIGHLGLGVGFKKDWKWNSDDHSNPQNGEYYYYRLENDVDKYPSATYNLTGAINGSDAWDDYKRNKTSFKVDLTWKITKSGDDAGESGDDANAEPTVTVTTLASGDYNATSAPNNKTVLTLTLGSGTNKYDTVHKLTFKSGTNGNQLNWIVTKLSTDTANASGSVSLSGDKLTINATTAFRGGSNWQIEFVNSATGATKLVDFNATQLG